MLYLTIFLFVTVIYIVLFWVEIKAALDYIRNDQGEWMVISFYTLDGFLRYKYEIPLLKSDGDKVKFKLVKGQSREMCMDMKQKGRLMPLDIFKKYMSVKTYLEDHSSMFTGIRKYLNKKDVHVELNIKVQQGAGDAALTGLLCGLFWTFAGILTSHITRYLKSFKNEIQITPCFNKRIFEVDATCIFHVKLVHIIVVLIKIYLTKYLITHKSKKKIGGELSG